MSIASDVLNSAFQKDPQAIVALIQNRVPCNVSLAEDAYVEVGVQPVIPGPSYYVGALGLINGILSEYRLDKVAYMLSEPDSTGISQILGFCDLPPNRAHEDSHLNS